MPLFILYVLSFIRYQYSLHIPGNSRFLTCCGRPDVALRFYTQRKQCQSILSFPRPIIACFRILFHNLHISIFFDEDSLLMGGKHGSRLIPKIIVTMMIYLGMPKYFEIVRRRNGAHSFHIRFSKALHYLMYFLCRDPAAASLLHKGHTTTTHA